MEDYFGAYFQEYGLWAIFFLTMIEGDLTLLFAGFFSRGEFFDFGDVLLVGTAGGVTGDLVSYLIGRMFRGHARTLRFYMRAKPRIERLLRRFGGLALFLAKYTYGLRTATSVFCGLAHFGLGRFAPLTLLSCFAWVGLLSGAGYLFADSFDRLLGGDQIRRFERGILAVLLLLAVVVAIRRYRLGRRVIEE